MLCCAIRRTHDAGAKPKIATLAFSKLAMTLNWYIMNRYVIRTKENRTHLLSIEKESRLLGYIDDDFILKENKLPLLLQVKTPRGIKGYVETFYPEKSYIKVYDNKRGEIAYLGKEGRLRIDGLYMSFGKLSKEETILQEQKKEKKSEEKLEKSGLTHSYLLDDSEIKGKIYCFRKGRNISTLIWVKTKISAGIEELLRFIPLAISKRVFEQEFIRIFIGG